MSRGPESKADALTSSPAFSAMVQVFRKKLVKVYKNRPGMENGKWPTSLGRTSLALMLLYNA